MDQQKRTKIKDEYIEKAREIYDETGDLKEATQIAGEIINNKFGNTGKGTSPSNLRSITSEYRTSDGILREDILEDDTSDDEYEYDLTESTSVREEDDNYVYAFPNRGYQLIPVPKEVTHEVLFLYCDRKLTKNEIQNEFKQLTEQDIKTIIEAHDKTKHNDPFTIHQKEDMSVEDMVADTKERKEAFYHEQINKERSPIEHFKEILNEPEINFNAPDIVVSSNDRNNYCLTIPITDLHLGCRPTYSSIGIEGQAEITEQLVRGAIKDATEKGLPDHVKLLLMGDFFHIDNIDEETTYGTPIEACGSYQKIVKRGYELARNLISICNELASLEVVAVPGNHDENTTYGLMSHLDYVSSVIGFDYEYNLENSESTRAYWTYGKNLCGVTHQRKERIKDLDSIMMNEASDLLRDDQHQFFMGADKHTEELKSDYKSGMKFYRNPKMGPIDDYESSAGYTQRCGLNVFSFDVTHGRKSIDSKWVSELSV